MTKINTPEDIVASAPHTNGNAPNIDINSVVEGLKGGQAELHTKKEDTKGSSVVDGTVPLTPPINAPAPSANSE